MMDEDFRSAPRTVGELRSARSDNAADWAPRDLLVSLLRQIDSGEIAPDGIVVVMRIPGDKSPVVDVCCAVSDSLMALGLLARAQQAVVED